MGYPPRTEFLLKKGLKRNLNFTIYCMAAPCAVALSVMHIAASASASGGGWDNPGLRSWLQPQTAWTVTRHSYVGYHAQNTSVQWGVPFTACCKPRSRHLAVSPSPTDTSPWGRRGGLEHHWSPCNHRCAPAHERCPWWGGWSRVDFDPIFGNRATSRPLPNGH